VYWVLLTYIIAALIWWAFSLLSLSEEIYRLEKEKLAAQPHTSAETKKSLVQIEDHRRRNIGKYVGEGLTFLLFIFVGAVFIYRSVRGQLKQQQREQNFVMAVTHELKTPIAVSKLNLETLQRHQLDEAKRSRLVQNTLQENERLEILINNILISSQLDVRSYRMTKEELNFSDLIMDVANSFGHRYPDRPIVQHITDDVEVTGDPLLLKLLVSNLLENANKYASPKTPVAIELNQQGNQVVLKVLDEGPGIADEEKDKVFEKFYRIGNEQTRTAKGTGLGLYLCRKIAEDHQAIIQVKDNQPKGSIFIIQFPV
jgi:K+-sensing histidine kinase KdpD